MAGGLEDGNQMSEDETVQVIPRPKLVRVVSDGLPVSDVVVLLASDVLVVSDDLLVSEVLVGSDVLLGGVQASLISDVEEGVLLESVIAQVVTVTS